MMRKGVSEFVRGSLRNVSRSMSAKKDSPCKPCSESPSKSTSNHPKMTENLNQSMTPPKQPQIPTQKPQQAQQVQQALQSQNPWVVSNSTKLSVPSTPIPSSFVSSTASQSTSKSKPNSDRKSESNCHHHKDLIPPANELAKFKKFEVKSDCSSFQMKTKGF